MNKLLLLSGPPGGPLGNESGWTRLDSNPRNEPDILAALPPLPNAVKEKQWDHIVLLHGIEHFYIWEAQQLVPEMYAALRPGGVLTLEQPDISVCAEWILKGHDPAGADFPEQYRTIGIFGDPSHKDPSMIHKWGYTPRTLRKLLVEGGFREDRILFSPARYHQPMRDFRVEATK